MNPTADSLAQRPYPPLGLYIDGVFIPAQARPTLAVDNPADGQVIGQLPMASPADVDRAVAAAEQAFGTWRQQSPLARSDLLRRAAGLIRARADTIGRDITLDQGKPLAEAVAEVMASAEHLEWHAEEGRRIYGRVVPARHPQVRQTVVREPIGVCAAFSPWNFPFNQALRKVAAALASGCTMVIKGPEEAPSALVALAQAFHDAGLPPGCLNLVFGEPARISQQLIADPRVRKVSFTGSVAVGKTLAALAGQHMKRMTMELGGHAPVVVCADADVARAAALLAPYKHRNAGQVCVSPTRFFVHRSVLADFVDRYAAQVAAIEVGAGLQAGTAMGPLAQARRVAEIEGFVADARDNGAQIVLGGTRPEGPGSFYPPTVVLEPPAHSRLMQQEPFGPISGIVGFDRLDEVLQRANALPFGLASYVFTDSARAAHRLSQGLEAGMVNINHFGMGPAEVPFGGIKDSGFGSEGGTETFDGYLATKLITHMHPD